MKLACLLYESQVLTIEAPSFTLSDVFLLMTWYI